jgi:nicotinamide mononucleotide transporter
LMARKTLYLYIVGGVISTVLMLGSLLGWLEFGYVECLAFITGALCVWLTVDQNIWNWPIGIANNIFFVVLFLQARLFGDMSLQVVYIALDVIGWYWWLYGGPTRTNLPVGRTSALTWVMLAILLVAGTAVATVILQRINDFAPFWDALTTVMSLVAQYMLTRKLIENWFVWLSADVMYIALYVAKHLYLTAGLYGIFIAMCCAGLVQWRASLRQSEVRGSAAEPRSPLAVVASA